MTFIHCLFILFGITACIQLYFVIGHIQAFRKVQQLAIFQPQKDLPAASIIICAKNELNNLQANIPFFYQQNYPKDAFEIIIVNDGSTDGSSSWLQQLSMDNPKIKIVDIPNSIEKDLPGKKYALRHGIAAASHAYIVLSDADCKPVSPFWLQSLVQASIEQDKPIILGYGAYAFKNTFLNQFIQFETLHTAIQYYSAAVSNAAYMGVGRNLLYKKETIEQLLQDPVLLQQWKLSVSGDDDILITHAARNDIGIGVQIEPNAFTLSTPQDTWKSYFRQKARHTSSAKYYANKNKFTLASYAFSHALFWILSVTIFLAAVEVAWIQPAIYSAFVLLWIIVILAKFIQYKKWGKALKTPALTINLISLDFFWMIYNVILSPYIFWKNKQQWK